MRAALYAWLWRTGVWMADKLSGSDGPRLTPLDAIETLSPLVTRVLGQNASSFTLQGTNTYLVGAKNRKILIDTGEHNVKKYIENLKEALGDDKIICIICTHWHDDHVGGVRNVIDEIIKEPVPVFKFKRPDQPDAESTYQFLNDGQTISTEGATLRVIATPGHTMDHISLYLEEEQALFSGDCILGEGTTVFEDLYEYMVSLKKLLDLQPMRIYPGHGPVVENAVQKITEYIDHRNKRENDIIEALRILKSASSMKITSHIYKNLNVAVKVAALGNVNHHLDKLLKERKIMKTNNDCYELYD